MRRTWKKTTVVVVLVIVAYAPITFSQQRLPWGAEQATGKPDTMQAGDFRTAWATLKPEMGTQWIELSYQTPLEPAKIRIHETFNPGAVSKIEVFNTEGKPYVAWKGIDTNKECPGYFEVDISLVKVKINRVKIYLDTNRVRGWNEIDAVELVGKSGTREWAVSAKASSSYSEQSPRIVKTTPQIGASDVDPSLREITITFNRDMASSYSWTGGGKLYPKTTARPYWKDKRTCVLPVQLEAGRFYRVGINAGRRYSGFRSKDGNPAETWAIWFTTTGASTELKAKLKQPKIVSTSPKIGDQQVDPNLTEIRITFDQEMGGGFSWTGGGSLYPKTTGRPYWNTTRRTCTLPVELEPNHQYRFGINSWSYKNFCSAYGVPVASVTFYFKTREGTVKKEGKAKGTSNYVTDLEAFFKEVDHGYPFFELKGIRKDWEETKKRLRGQVKKCESGEAFLGVVLEAVKCLRDSHISLTGLKAKLPPWPQKYYPGISFLPATDERVVIMYGPRGFDDLKMGTVVTKIDGKDARRLLEERAKSSWSAGGFFSSPQRARLFEYRIPFRGEKGEKHTITILIGGKEREIELTSNIRARGWPHTYNLPSNLTRSGRSCWYTKLSSGVGYIYLRRVDNSAEPGIAAALSAYPDAKGWITDLRGNGGGGYGQSLLNRIKTLPRPVAAIIDAGCTSAGETLARDLVNLAKARLFGSTTAGSSTAKREWTFPSGIAKVRFSWRSRWGIGGKPIEFNGIKPDVEVEAVPEELQRGLNSAILRAEEYITAARKTQGAKK